LFEEIWPFLGEIFEADARCVAMADPAILPASAVFADDPSRLKD
jgi:hypothetical protein